MDKAKLNLLVTYNSRSSYKQNRLEDRYLDQIREIASEINITVVDLARSDTEVKTAARQQLDTLLRETEIIYGHRLPKHVVKRTPALKWFQAMSVGVDMLLDDEFRQSKVILTNMRGIASVPIAESVMTMMLSITREMELCYEQKKNRVWNQFHPGLLSGKTIGIVGLGSIGRQVARLAKSFDMKVAAADFKAKPDMHMRNVDLLFSPHGLGKLLSLSDFVVLTVPLTAGTRGLVGRQELQRMKPAACLINVSRGPVVDEAALIHALQEHLIAAAALDVFVNEPLPEDSPLWNIPNLIICPHIAAYIEDYNARATAIFCENLRRYMAGKRLKNLVDKKKGF